MEHPGSYYVSLGESAILNATQTGGYIYVYIYIYIYIYIYKLYLSLIIQMPPQKLSAEPRNSASAEALAVARRPKEASREKTRPPPVSRGSSP